jgi:hypothetical protein
VGHSRRGGQVRLGDLEDERFVKEDGVKDGDLEDGPGTLVVREL